MSGAQMEDRRRHRLADSALPETSAKDPRRWVRFIAAAGLVVVGARISLPQGIEAGFIVAAVLTPVWVRAVRTYRWGWIVIGAGMLAALMGWWLDVFNAASQDTDPSLFASTTILMVGAVLSFGFILWARRVLLEPNVWFWFGIGLVAGITPSSPLFASNPWKFGFALPVSLILLALTLKSGRRVLQLLALCILTVVSAFTDSRSAFGLLLFGVIVFAVGMIPRRPGRKLSALRVILGLGGLVAVVFNLGQALILDGYLGESTQARSLEQLRTSGSLLLGGRPELAATVSLMQHQPWGYGAGAIPNLTDVTVAKSGMASINYAPNNGYVEKYMFGGHIELHSVFGDLWAHFGFAGLLFVVVLLIVSIWGLSTRIAARDANGAVLYIAATSLWAVLFSPFYSAEPLLMLTLAMLIVPRVAAGGLLGSLDRSSKPKILQPLTNSMTSSIGPVKRVDSRKPAESRSETSADPSAVG